MYIHGSHSNKLAGYKKIHGTGLAEFKKCRIYYFRDFLII